MRPEYYRVTRVTIDGGREVCVRLAGDFDHDACGDLERELTGAVLGTAAPLFVADLGETKFLGSEAVGVLLSGLLRAREHGKQVSIVNAHGVVRTVLVVTGILDLFGDAEDGPPVGLVAQ
ncbi:STAS domain-containing protein [Actinoplanes sp. RD1]|uniref:STAS domain-containing protein n=1 Tax=Actinoplanes sp. RD1 TaxID=3064538 RepID=UPI0027422DBD|nr:STAS domain-containing protein [Actinoplanes sp. RD1]